MKNSIIYSGITALVVTLATYATMAFIDDDRNKISIDYIATTPVKDSATRLDTTTELMYFDFTATAERVIDGVVHIKSVLPAIQVGSQRPFSNPDVPDLFKDFFGDDFDRFFRQYPQDQNLPQDQQPKRIGSGSGVIISDDGYIVTNNHVISSAQQIEVTLYDNRTYNATVVGTDPTTDLALIKIKEKGLSSIPYANSEEVKVGEWVIAAGNPFSLNSTITAGIVSAKGRNINILREQYAVEDFIQTDAAINPGNSGGALVNLQGGLVGINTAIASPSGVYSGYGFAIPTNIVRKVVEDLLKYGLVQRGVLGIMIRSVDGNFAKEKKLAITQGIYVDSLLEKSAAGSAGVNVGDVIIAINDIVVKSSPELQGIIAQHRPGETVTLTINRKGTQKEIKVVLQNRQGNTKIIEKKNREVTDVLGASFVEIDQSLAEKLGIKGGVRVTKLQAGKLREYTQIREGFIITHVNGTEVNTIDQFVNILENSDGGIMLEGVYENRAGKYYYAFGM